MLIKVQYDSKFYKSWILLDIFNRLISRTVMKNNLIFGFYSGECALRKFLVYFLVHNGF